MLYTKLAEKYGYNNPIFAEEILNCFNEYTKAYTYRLLQKELKNNNIKKFSNGVYFIPSKTILGETMITSRDVAMKKYIYDATTDKVNGIFSGLSLANEFNLTTQVPNTLTIITNNEVTRSRVVYIKDMKYVLKKSRLTINNDNVYTYKILELLTENDLEDFNEQFYENLSKYIKKFNVKTDEVINMLDKFPAKTSKRFLKIRGQLNSYGTL